MSKVVVIGGGAAGMMASIIAARNGHTVTLIEKNDKLGKKLFITGKGRCNFTNAGDEDDIKNSVVTNPKFMYSSFKGFSNYDVMGFFVSFHRDITDKSGSSRGISAWIHTSSPSNSKSLASDIMEELNGVDVSLSGVNTGTPDNKSKDYYLNQHSKVASCIIELGNMYSSKDNKLVTTDIDNTAKLIADGIMKYLEQAGYTNGSN